MSALPEDPLPPLYYHELAHGAGHVSVWARPRGALIGMAALLTVDVHIAPGAYGIDRVREMAAALAEAAEISAAATGFDDVGTDPGDYPDGAMD
jgi:hypothetical protein